MSKELIYVSLPELKFKLIIPDFVFLRYKYGVPQVPIFLNHSLKWERQESQPFDLTICVQNKEMAIRKYRIELNIGRQRL